jgi:hypothetical protein
MESPFDVMQTIGLLGRMPPSVTRGDAIAGYSRQSFRKLAAIMSLEQAIILGSKIVR